MNVNLKKGEKAPCFILPNQDDRKIDLKSFRSKKHVLIYFYPKALTPGCTVQACAIRDYKKEFDKLDVVVLGISPDPLKSLVKFKEKKNLNFDLLADKDHKVSIMYGVWGEKQFMGRKYLGVSRSSFIVNKEGILFEIIPKVSTKTHHEEALQIFRSL